MHLTERQHQVLRGVAAGLSTRQIARELCISERTVDTHLQRLFDQNGVRTRAALVAVWMTATTNSRGGPRVRSR